YFYALVVVFFFFSSRRRHTRFSRDWSSDVCSSDLSMGDVFNTLQATLGGFYVNDFNAYGRTWQVNVQAEAGDRNQVRDIFRIHRSEERRVGKERRSLCAPYHVRETMRVSEHSDVEN